MNLLPRTVLLLSAAFGVSFVGCGGNDGPPLAPVSGVVTMDGQPLSGVVVSFVPQGEGNASMGTTDDSGRYTLQYTADREGALIGEHDVQIINPTDDATGQPIGPPVPSKYNTQSTLTATVEDTNNTIDFKLTSE